MILPMGPASEALGYLALGVVIVAFKKFTDVLVGLLTAGADKFFRPTRPGKEQ